MAQGRRGGTRVGVLQAHSIYTLSSDVLGLFATHTASKPIHSPTSTFTAPTSSSNRMEDTSPPQPSHLPSRCDTCNKTVHDEASLAAATLLQSRNQRPKPVVKGWWLSGVSVLAAALWRHFSTTHTNGPTNSEPSINHQIITGAQDWLLLKCSPVEEGPHLCDFVSAPRSWVPVDPCSGEPTTIYAGLQNEDGSILITIPRSEVEKHMECSHGDSNSDITTVAMYVIHSMTDVPQDATTATIPTTLNGHTDRT